MTSNFATAMASCAKTWNGAVSLSSPDITGNTSGRIGLFFKSVRGLNAPRLYEYLRESAQENIIDAFLLAFHIRDCRGGKGERELGRRSLVWLFLNYPEQFNLVAPLISEYGRWDDLMELWPGVLDLKDATHLEQNYCSTIKDISRLRDLQITFVKILGNQLVNDRNQMHDGKPISICAKWAPTEKDSYDKKYGVFNTLTKVMGITAKTYRKAYITPLRQYLHIVERYMCDKKWNEIDYSKVPSCAMKRLKKAFERNAPEEFLAWKTKLQTGEVKVNGKQLYPHELIHEIRTKHRSDTVCEAQWKVLEDEVNKLGSLQDSLFVCDVSTSMLSWSSDQRLSFCPMDVAVGLSLLGANNVKGVFHNHIITFHDKPSFHVVKDGTLYDRWLKLTSSSWGGSTNLQATFDLILNQAKVHKLSQEDMPKRLYIISDMQFDSADRSHMTNFQAIKTKYAESGYIQPQIIFWNVCGSSTDFPVSVTDNGTALISGFSASVMSALINGTDFSPYSTLRNTLDSQRLEPVRRVLEKE